MHWSLLLHYLLFTWNFVSKGSSHFQRDIRQVTLVGWRSLFLHWTLCLICSDSDHGTGFTVVMVQLSRLKEMPPNRRSFSRLFSKVATLPYDSLAHSLVSFCPMATTIHCYLIIWLFEYLFIYLFFYQLHLNISSLTAGPQLSCL